MKIDQKEIEKIKINYGFDGFYTVDYDGEEYIQILKKKAQSCIFLQTAGAKSSCKIYKDRPKVCQDYPFLDADKVESCKPGKNIKL